MRRIVVRDFQTVRAFAPVSRTKRTLMTISMRAFGPLGHRIEVVTVRAITRGRRMLIMPPAARI